jgi:1-acyl-sn-glycerol-3-phosphate acyltransferase
MAKLNFFCKVAIDVFVTFVCWIYYTFGFIIIFAPAYTFCTLFKQNKELSYQRLNYHFYRTFFLLLEFITPGLRIRFQGGLENIKSSIIVSNHLSYLDPLLLISIYKRHKTIVKDKFFNIPIFGFVLKRSGYIPSTSKGKLAYLTIHQMEQLKDFFSAGGNLFIFPEGTRFSHNKHSSFYQGAFKIAKRYNVPIRVVSIQNTDLFFPPGKLLFNTGAVDSITVVMLGTIYPDLSGKDTSVSELMEQAQHILNSREDT